jgi:mono/diheme cytochrome c family protein
MIDEYHLFTKSGKRLLGGLGLGLGLVMSLGCSEAPREGSGPASVSPGGLAQSPNPVAGSRTDEAVPAQAKLIARGRSVYVSNCSACHNPDPGLPGSLGPEIAGSSRALLEAKLLRNSYPEGYKPKRDSRVMMALPYLKGEIGALAAYLASLKPN